MTRQRFCCRDRDRAALCVRCAVALVAVLLARPAPGKDLLLDRFPIVVHAGVASHDYDRAGDPVGFADLPFSPARGYGYVGGHARTLARAAVRGLDTARRIAWRENPRKYAFRVPNRQYLVRLSFLETDTAQPGVRVFDVAAEKIELVAGLDIAGEVGDFRWLTIEGLVTVRDGWLDIDFTPAPSTAPSTVASAGGSPENYRRLPPRVSEIRIEPVRVASLPRPKVPRPRGEGRYRRARVSWAPVPTRGLAGYGVFRASTEDGPFESLTELPILATEYIDRDVRQGASAFYRVRAYGVGGAQSALSPAVNITPRSGPPGDLKVFELRVPAAGLPDLLTRMEPAPEVAGEILFLGRNDEALVRSETTLADWQFRKSYRVRLRSGRRFFSRKVFRFLGEAGDPTLLREMLYHALAARVGLAAPSVEPVRLFLNGHDEGLVLNRENQDSRFLERAGLDRRGVLVRADLSGELRLTWQAVGEQIGRGGGGLSALSILHQELWRVNRTEIDDWFERRFYLDRLLSRLAMAAICGRDEGVLESRFLLGDSRNGKWEVLPDRAPDGALGITFFGQPRAGPGLVTVSPERARRDLFGPGLVAASLPRPGWQLLETRIFNTPALWRRYLARIEAILHDTLTVDVVGAIIEEKHAALALGEGEAAELWPFDGGATFARGPGLVGTHFAAHRDALLAAVARERLRLQSKDFEPVVLAEFLLRPAAPVTAPAALDGAWIEIWNRSERAVALGAYRLATDPSRPGAWALPAVSLGPDERRLVTLGSGGGPFHSRLRPSPGGGVLVLSSVDPRGRATVADLVFYGHQTPGFSCARGRGAPDSDLWSFGRPTPAAPPVVDSRGLGPPAEPPSWRYSWKQEVERDGSLVLSVKPGSPVKEVFLCRRSAGSADFDHTPMTWHDQRFRFEATVQPVEGSRAMPFFFLARAASGLERTYPLTGSDLPLFIASRPRIFINEVLPRPAADGERAEFIELYNAGDEPVSVEGMYLTDRRRNTVRWRLRETTPIPPKGFVVFRTGRGGAPFRLSNSGEYLGLYHRHEEGNILVDHMTFTAVPVGKSWGRRRDGKKGFRVWKDPTPGAKNMPKIPEEYLRKKKRPE